MFSHAHSAQASSSQTHATSCPRAGVLGTSRTLVVDAKTTPRVGLKSFPQTLPLQDHEVVLTFDDGPAATTPKVLEALANECVLATFFLVGKPASSQAALVRRIVAEGHTVGHHTYTHKHLNQLSYQDALAEIDRGIAADEKALHGEATDVPSTPFFRFPYFESTPALLDDLQKRGIVVFGADLWASDWLPMTPEQELKLITDRLKVTGRGIILFHDPHHHTANMMPAFLKWLRENNYRVVHVVPANPEPTVAGTPTVVQ
nr:polysaccharide deacetylase family protein [Rhodopseudomonas sp. B29]